MFHHSDCELAGDWVMVAVGQGTAGIALLGDLLFPPRGEQDPVGPARHPLFLRCVVDVGVLVQFVGGQEGDRAFLVTPHQRHVGQIVLPWHMIPGLVQLEQTVQKGFLVLSTVFLLLAFADQAPHLAILGLHPEIEVPEEEPIMVVPDGRDGFMVGEASSMHISHALQPLVTLGLPCVQVAVHEAERRAVDSDAHQDSPLVPQMVAETAFHTVSRNVGYPVGNALFDENDGKQANHLFLEETGVLVGGGQEAFLQEERVDALFEDLSPLPGDLSALATVGLQDVAGVQVHHLLTAQDDHLRSNLTAPQEQGGVQVLHGDACQVPGDDQDAQLCLDDVLLLSILQRLLDLSADHDLLSLIEA